MLIEVIGGERGGAEGQYLLHQLLTEGLPIGILCWIHRHKHTHFYIHPRVDTHCNDLNMYLDTVYTDKQIF